MSNESNVPFRWNVATSTVVLTTKTENTISTCDESSRSIVQREKDDITTTRLFLTPVPSETFLGRNEIRLILGNNFEAGNETFVVTDEKTYLHAYSRPARRNIRVERSERRHDRHTSLKRPRTVETFHDRTKERSRSYEESPLTTEQSRIMNVIDQIVNVAKNDACRRVAIDGAAGCGKTFIFGHLLKRNPKVVYLAKTKYFVQNIRDRYGDIENLSTFTIDSFLMRVLGIRNLKSWIRRRVVDMDGLRDLACHNALLKTDERLFFIDEFGLMKGSLADLLNIVLRRTRCVVVGDCNQQSAINDISDRPLRTLLGYERICFMYDNVRTRDSNLLDRLSRFTNREDDASAIAFEGLPIVNVVRLAPYLNSHAEQKFRKLSLLPKIIVRSNERVNYANWAIGNLLWNDVRETNDSNESCLRYSREIFINGDVPRCTLDDPYSDEHFIIVGLMYRVIDARSSWPVVAGSRVIVRSIVSSERIVVAPVDSNDAFTVDKMYLEPYQYGSRWSDVKCTIRMFPLVMDAATSVYQIQGVTLKEKDHANCYIDLCGMDSKAMYVTLSRFETIRQLIDVINIPR